MSFACLSNRSSKQGNNLPRKIRQEEIFIRRRDSEKKHRDLWNGVTNYFHSWDVKTNKFNSWASPEYFHSSEEAYNAQKKQREKKESLARRRAKLAELLEREKLEWEIELKERRTKFRFGRERRIEADMPGLESLLALNEQMKQRREELRRSEAKLRMHRWWTMNNPVLREFESKEKEKFVRQAWEEQVEEKRAREAEKIRVEREEEALRKKQLEEEYQIEKRRMEDLYARQKRNKEDLLNQHLEQLRIKQQLAEQLKEEEAQTLAEQMEVDKLFRERRLIEERRKIETNRLSLTKQIQLRLRRTAKENREALEEDIQILRAAMEADQLSEESARLKRIETKELLEGAYQEFKKQAEYARIQEEEAQSLFHEEAVRMWKRHEERWRKEQDARDKLMQEVLQALKDQVSQNLERNRREQIETLEARGKLLEEAEEIQKEILVEKEIEAEKKTLVRRNLLCQMEEKQKMEEELKKQEELEAAAKEEEEKKEQEKIVKEIRKLQITYNPMKQPYPKRVW
ncbi:trichoplein keratin filament-binding protein [Ischnura elegans]|uniref:trichoplein keratin filament-binding protein n=1 Tax=Ischnura elegans TaxID=197161 RepID=UPI001ED8B966|nr:trichoplein keratin filament-binding protein [Ischnura elegans]